MDNKDNTGIFVFDYNRMNGCYGIQAFEAICNSLADSKGVCAFHDGDLFNRDTLRELIRQAKLIKLAEDSSGTSNPLSNPNDDSSFGPYIVGLWTTGYENFEILHHGLLSGISDGYLGLILLPGNHPYAEIIAFMMKNLGISQGIVLKDGAVVKGTAKYGIGVNPADAKLLFASIRGNVDSVVEALKEGADANCIDSNDRTSTPLFHAVCEDNLEVLEILLKHGADPNANNGVNTALMIAARRGFTNIVKVLVSAGVDVNACNRDGSTALDNASEHPEIQDILREAGGLSRK